MSSVHLDVGMHCVDCHFSQDSHGNGHLYGEVAAAIEIDCVDCHGTIDRYPTLFTSGPAARPGGTDLGLLAHARRPPALRVARRQALPALGARSEAANGSCRWSRTPSIRSTQAYNEKAARAKLMARGSFDSYAQNWGPSMPRDQARARQRRTWPVIRAICRGPRAATAATCRSRRTGKPTACTSKAVPPAITRPTTRRSCATISSSSAGMAT